MYFPSDSWGKFDIYFVIDVPELEPELVLTEHEINTIHKEALMILIDESLIAGDKERFMELSKLLK